MSDFHNAQTPDDLPLSHQGEYWPDERDDVEVEIASDETGADDADNTD